MEITEKQNVNPREQAYNFLIPILEWNSESIALNEPTLKRSLEILLPGKVIQFVSDRAYAITVHGETGTVIDCLPGTGEEMSNVKTLGVKFKKIKCIDDFNNADFKSKYVYINRITKQTVASGIEKPREELLISMFEYQQIKKTTVSFTIDGEIYEKFLEIADENAINKSKFVENKIKEFINLVSK